MAWDAETAAISGHPEIASCLRVQAITRDEVGDLTGALGLRERGLAIAEAALGNEHPRVAIQLSDLREQPPILG